MKTALYLATGKISTRKNKTWNNAFEVMIPLFKLAWFCLMNTFEMSVLFQSCWSLGRGKICRRREKCLTPLRRFCVFSSTLLRLADAASVCRLGEMRCGFSEAFQKGIQFLPLDLWFLHQVDSGARLG